MSSPLVARPLLVAVGCASFLWGCAGYVLAQAPTAPDDDASPKTITVVVEGVGKDAASALQDAFRVAVQQALGLVVDAQTLIDNDELIGDKILTASNGFLAGYERIGIKEVDGLTRVKIKARVERSDLVEGLRKFNIRVTEFDASSVLPDADSRRFSDERVAAMSKEEMQSRKTEILHDVLLDFPKLLEARAKIPDRFDYNKETEKLALTVRVSYESKTYEAYLKRLKQRLDKLSLARGSCDAVAAPRDVPTEYGTKARGFETVECPCLSGPDLSRHPEGWCLWVLSEVARGGAGTRWTGYVLDSDVRKTLSALHGELSVLCELLDENGDTITDQSFDLTSHPSWLGVYKSRGKQSLSHTQDHPLLAPPDNELAVTQEASVNAFLAPFWLQTRWAHVNRIGRGSTQLYYLLAWDQPLEVQISPAELERMKNVRCTVQFQPRSP